MANLEHDRRRHRSAVSSRPVQTQAGVVVAAENHIERNRSDGLLQTPTLLCGLLLALPLFVGKLHGAGPVLIAYGGFNETMAPMWVGVEKGLFRKYGVDAQRPADAQRSDHDGDPRLRRRASRLGGAEQRRSARRRAGMKLGCFAAGNNRLPRELIVSKGIESTEDLRGKTFGVQSIGGGAWLSTMVALDALGLDPDKYKLNMRVIGDTGTQTQALLSGNIDAAVLPYSYADIAKRAGARSLADVGALKVVYQATVMCALKDSSTVTPETHIALTKGLIESLIYILEPANRREVARDTQKKPPLGQRRRRRKFDAHSATADAQH